MQLSRTALTIALVASTASALPRCRTDSEDCASPQDLNRNNPKAATDANGQQSTHGSTQAHMESGFHSTDLKENFSTDQQAQRDMTKNSASQGAPNMNSPAYKQNANPMLNASDKQSEQTIHVMKAAESQSTGQDSTRPSGDNKMPYIEQSISGYKHQNGANSQTNAGRMGHTQNQMNSNHAAGGGNGVNHAKPSTSKMGFTHKVRALFDLFRQGQNQGQMHPEQQAQEMGAAELDGQQQQRFEPSIGIRQAKGHDQASSMEHHSGMPHGQGMYMPHEQGQNSMMHQGQTAQGSVQDEMDSMNTNQKQGENTWQHNAEYQEISQVSEPLYMSQSPNHKISRSHTQQHTEGQIYSQEHEHHEESEVQPVKYMDQGMQQHETMQMDNQMDNQMNKRYHKESQNQQGMMELQGMEHMDNSDQIQESQQEMNKQENHQQQQHQGMEQSMEQSNNNQEQFSQQQQQ
jgi:hypothetical protein